MVPGRVGGVEASGNSCGSRTETGQAGAIRAREDISIGLRDAKRKTLFDETSAPITFSSPIQRDGSRFLSPAIAWAVKIIFRANRRVRKELRSHSGSDAMNRNFTISRRKALGQTTAERSFCAEECLSEKEW
jgi:hypothetical protein